jgi:hypothetical protein
MMMTMARGIDNNDGGDGKEKLTMTMVAMKAKEIYDNGDNDNDSGGDGKRN